MPNQSAHDATAALLQRWHEELNGGAKRVGWKIGLNDAKVRRSLGIEEMVVGYLTDRTHFEPGEGCDAGQFQITGLEPEIAVYLQKPLSGNASDEEVRAAIGGIGPAVEVIGFDLPMGDVASILSSNIFHRGVTFASPDPARSGDSLDGLSVSLLQDGEKVATGIPSEVLSSLTPFVTQVANTLHAHGEMLAAGDRIISGSLTAPLRVKPGNSVTADFGDLGVIELSVLVSKSKSGGDAVRVERKLG